VAALAVDEIVATELREGAEDPRTPLLTFFGRGVDGVVHRVPSESTFDATVVVRFLPDLSGLVHGANRDLMRSLSQRSPTRLRSEENGQEVRRVLVRGDRSLAIEDRVVALRSDLEPGARAKLEPCADLSRIPLVRVHLREEHG